MGRKRCRPAQLHQYLAHLGPVERGWEFAALQQQIEKIVVGQVHQILQALGLAHAQTVLMLPEEALDEQVVLEQAPPATPFQAAQGTIVQ